MLLEVKRRFQSDVQLFIVRGATRQLIAVLNFMYRVSNILCTNGEMFSSTKLRFSINGGYVQLHAKTADLLIRLKAYRFG